MRVIFTSLIRFLEQARLMDWSGYHQKLEEDNLTICDHKATKWCLVYRFRNSEPEPLFVVEFEYNDDTPT
jgi:hypothetical protein